MDIYILISAFGLSTLLHFVVQKVFIYLKKFDDFNYRSSHDTLATRTGGIGVFITVFLISLFHYYKGIELFEYSLFIPLGIMFIIGVYDDFYKANFKLKFFLQIIVAKILIDQGFVISNYYGLFGLYEIPWLLAQLSTIFVFLVVVNSINFIDGIDGLAITEVIKIIIIIEFLSESFTQLFPLGALVIASLIPLYFFNFKKNRKVFLGDAGSLLLGTLIMIYLLYVLGSEYNFNPKYMINKTQFSVLIILYPLIDLLRVFILRIRERKSPFIADNNHIHHVLVRRFTHFQAILLIILISIIFYSICALIYF